MRFLQSPSLELVNRAVHHLGRTAEVGPSITEVANVLLDHLIKIAGTAPPVCFLRLEKGGKANVTMLIGPALKPLKQVKIGGAPVGPINTDFGIGLLL